MYLGTPVQNAFILRLCNFFGFSLFGEKLYPHFSSLSYAIEYAAYIYIYPLSTYKYFKQETSIVDSRKLVVHYSYQEGKCKLIGFWK